ncbi:hypothetical protein QVD17_20423 [Tagetes erecta]|uniref:F-box domain-containing protein n=1 Tax=Tagetes erecta TaxID=13708 RepID=A0AAD8KLQ3_TARER|nr:hypothetical protein QVD17_20423 [Tagetes erecta]
MSDNIPFEIQVEIIKRFPVKSLIQFRSVSKTWKHLIDSSDFIAHYSGQQQHLLIRYDDVVCEEKYVSLIDDDTFPQHKLSHTLPQLVNMPKLSSIIGSSHGLLCFYGVIRENCGGYGSVQTSLVVVWNISIRKVVGVVVPKDGDGTFTSLGFGVCRETSDVKILKITHTESMSDVPWQVDVFTLKTRVWRSSYGNLPRKSINFSVSKVVIDGVLYWLAIESSDNRYLIISFDMTSEEFREVSLPDNIAYGYSDINPGSDLFLSKLSESLIVLECIKAFEAYMQVYKSLIA